MLTATLKSIRKFHRDDDGLEALQVVMVIAIAAMVMVSVAAVGKKAKDWMGMNSGKVMKLDLTNPAGLDGDGGGGLRGADEVIPLKPFPTDIDTGGTRDGVGGGATTGGGGVTAPDDDVIPLKLFPGG